MDLRKITAAFFALWLASSGLQAQQLKPSALSGTASGEITTALAQTPLHMEASANSPVVAQLDAKAKLELQGFAIDTMARRIYAKDAAQAEGLFFKVKSGDLTGYVPRWSLQNDSALQKIVRQIYPDAPAPTPKPNTTDTKPKDGKGKGGKKGK